jgi:hypothetical protein
MPRMPVPAQVIQSCGSTVAWAAVIDLDLPICQPAATAPVVGGRWSTGTAMKAVCCNRRSPGHGWQRRSGRAAGAGAGGHEYSLRFSYRTEGTKGDEVKVASKSRGYTALHVSVG